jgi:hypothetical protein
MQSSMQDTKLFSPYFLCEEYPLCQAKHLYYNAAQETLPGRPLHTHELCVLDDGARELCDVSDYEVLCM